jgi:hypothetical protein
MSPKLIAVVAISTMCLLSAAPAGSSSTGPTAEVVIRVTSATPGHEVQVEGAYVYAPGDSSFHHVTQQTPFEVKERASQLVGIFGTASAEAPIRVEMVSQGKQSGHSVATATGKAVSVRTNEHEASSAIAGF